MAGLRQQCAVLSIELCSKSAGDFATTSSRTVDSFKGTALRAGANNMVARFPLADPAFSAASRMLNTALEQGMLVKGGLHFGEADGGQDRTAGIADQISALAAPGEVLLSGATLPYLCGHFREQCVQVSSTTLAGDAAPSKIFAFKKQIGDQTIVGLDPTVQDLAAVSTRLVLIQGEREYYLTPDCERLLIGRAPDCDIILEGDRCSRNHALIERRQDSYVLLDQSTNGTFVINQYQETAPLLRHSTTLSGSGQLCFGGRQPDTVQDTLAFRVEPDQ